MLIAWFPILVLPVLASYARAKPEEAEEVSQNTQARDGLTSVTLYDQPEPASSACDTTPDIESLLQEQQPLENDSWPLSENSLPDDLPDEWTDGQHWREKRQAEDPNSNLDELLEHLDPKRAKPSFNSWGGKRTSNFHSWGGKRSGEDTTDILDETKRNDPFIILKFADSLDNPNGGFKRRPSFNSWGGKRSGAAFNSWGGKRGPAFNSWGGKRAPPKPAFNSWGGKRGPAFNSWGGKRSPAFNSWGGKRAPTFNSWGGKRAPTFNSWGGKRAPTFNSWGGKRAPTFNSWGGKRAPTFNSWGGKRATGSAFNSWGGKRAPTFNSWGGKRSPAFNSWGGKRANSGPPQGGKRGPAFYSWGGKRSSNVNYELNQENRENDVDSNLGLENEPSSSIEPISLKKRETKNLTAPSGVSSDKNTENEHNLKKRAVDSTVEFTETTSERNDRVLPSLEAAEKLYRDFKEREKKCANLKSNIHGERVKHLLNYILNLRLSDREPEEKKSVIHKMLLRAADYSPDSSTFTQSRRGAEFHSWGGKRSEIKAEWFGHD